MKTKIVKLFSLFMVAILLCFTVACGNEQENKVQVYNTVDVENENSQIVAVNEKYELEWDSENTALLLRSLKTGNVWCTTPYNFYKNNPGTGLASVQLTSPINVSYVEPENLNVKTAIGTTGVLKNGRVESKKIINGIRITYHFDKIGASIPIEYILTDRGVELRLVVKDIVETTNSIYQVDIHPYMISAENNGNSYLVVPSGSGGVIKAENSFLKTYSEPVYGEDPVKVSYTDTVLTEESRMPIFGSADGTNSMLAVIEKGAESAVIEANACDPEIGYSGAYVGFMLRGYDLTSFADNVGVDKFVRKYSDKKIDIDYMSVCYYPLEEYTPDYSGMAALYRDILRKKNVNLSEKEGSPIVSVDILGGAEAKKLFLGFPYRSLETSTTIKQAKDIVNELNMDLDSNLLINLSGFTMSGLDIGEIGGGFKLSPKLGGRKELTEFVKYCRDNKNPVFFDFDIIHFSSSGVGFKKATDSVKTANLVVRNFEQYNIATNTGNKNNKKYYLLSPAKLSKAGSELIEAINYYDLSGVSVKTLGNMTYSDYSYGQYYCKGGNIAEITKVMNSVKENNTEIITSDANIFTALLSDYVTDTPFQSSKYDCIDKDIPLYQMVLKGSVPLYSSSINAAKQPQMEYLKAIESGIGLNFSIVGEYTSQLISSSHNILSSSRYSSVKNEIIEKFESSKEYLETVKNTVIISHDENEGLAKTVFDNGICVYVNFTEKDLITPLGTVGAKSFVFGREK